MTLPQRWHWIFSAYRLEPNRENEKLGGVKGILRSDSPPSSAAGPGFPHPGKKGSVGPALQGGHGRWGSFCGSGASVPARGSSSPQLLQIHMRSALNSGSGPNLKDSSQGFGAGGVRVCARLRVHGCS